MQLLHSANPSLKFTSTNTDTFTITSLIVMLESIVVQTILNDIKDLGARE